MRTRLFPCTEESMEIGIEDNFETEFQLAQVNHDCTLDREIAIQLFERIGSRFFTARNQSAYLDAQIDAFETVTECERGGYKYLIGRILNKRLQRKRASQNSAPSKDAPFAPRDE